MLPSQNYCKPPSRKLAKYAQALYARKHECQIVPRDIITLNDWQPVQNQCHANVLILETYGQGYSAVHGWLYIDYDGKADFVRFVAHSVLMNDAGKLIDVTPAFAGSEPYPFISANISNTEYEDMLNSLLKKYGTTDCLDYQTKNIP